MNTEMTARAHAKINLHLDILDRRDDGFHDLVSLFQKISLHDEIHLSCRDSRETSCIVDSAVPVPLEQNTLYRAAAAFCASAGVSREIRISCTKGIPTCAGLGGGSSDAAQVLLMLNEMHGHLLPDERLLQIASSIGSDVPFFLGGPAACVGGRGELITPVMPRDDIEGVLIIPDFGVSTPEAYRALDASRAASRKDVGGHIPMDDQAMSDEYHKELRHWDFFNSFSSVLTGMYPVYPEIERLLRASGAVFSLISGSGSSIFGLSDGQPIELDMLKNSTDLSDMWVIPIKILAE